MSCNWKCICNNSYNNDDNNERAESEHVENDSKLVIAVDDSEVLHTTEPSEEDLEQESEEEAEEEAEEELEEEAEEELEEEEAEEELKEDPVINSLPSLHYTNKVNIRLMVYLKCVKDVVVKPGSSACILTDVKIDEENPVDRIILSMERMKMKISPVGCRLCSSSNKDICLPISLDR